LGIIEIMEIQELCNGRLGEIRVGIGLKIPSFWLFMMY